MYTPPLIKKPVDSSERTRRLTSRTLYANYLVNKQAFDDGITIHLPSGFDGATHIKFESGPLLVTPAEVATILHETLDSNRSVLPAAVDTAPIIRTVDKIPLRHYLSMLTMPAALPLPLTASLPLPLTASLPLPLTASLPLAAALSEPLSEPVSEPLSEPVSEPVSEPLSEPVSGPVSEPLSEPVSE